MHPSVGQTQTVHDPMDPARAEALATVFGLGPCPDPLPLFFHQVYFWDVRPPSGLGRDGHPAVGGFIPDLGLPRRMWAGGEVVAHRPLRLGRAAERETEILSIDEKTGRSGRLGFVVLRHRIRQDGALCVEERQDLVYRPEADPAVPPPAPRAAPEATGKAPLDVGPTLLFRYSALTMNGHRIHYDADYARAVEGYDGVVVHGPLLAQMMMLRAEARGPLRRFGFRGHRPLTLGVAAWIGWSEAAHWVETEAGTLVMEGWAEWA